MDIPIWNTSAIANGRTETECVSRLLLAATIHPTVQAVAVLVTVTTMTVQFLHVGIIRPRVPRFMVHIFRVIRHFKNLPGISSVYITSFECRTPNRTSKTICTARIQFWPHDFCDVRLRLSSRHCCPSSKQSIQSPSRRLCFSTGKHATRFRVKETL